MAVNLSPIGGAAGQFFDNNGDPLAGGLLYTYLAGTTTPAVTYYNSGGVTVNTNPIVLNSGGRVPNEIWLTDNVSYKFVLKDASAVLIGTWDNIVGINGNLNASSIVYNPAGTGAVATTVQAKLREIVSVMDFGAVGDGLTNDTAAINTAFSYAATSARFVYIPHGTYLVTNLLFGTQSTTTQSQAPMGVFGEGNGSIIKAAAGASGTLIQAWSCAATVWSNFLVDANNEAGITKVIDTEWKPGAGPDTQNRYNNIWVQSYAGTGWYNRNNNQSPFIDCVVRSPVASAAMTQVAWDQQGSGGQISMTRCNWPQAFIDVVCQNGAIKDCSGHGIRLSHDQTGDCNLDLSGSYMYSNAASTACVWTYTPSVAGHYTTGINGNNVFFTPTTAAHVIFDIGILGSIVLNGPLFETTVAYNFLGTNCKNWAGGGGSAIILNGANFTGGGVPTLNSLSAEVIRYTNNWITVNGTTQSFYEQGSFIPTVGATTETAFGQWTKIGNIVHINMTLAITTLGAGSASQISGLPFTSSSTGYSTGLSVSYFTSLASSVVFVGAIIATNSTVIQLTSLAGAAGSVTFPAGILGNASTVIITGSYQTTN